MSVRMKTILKRSLLFVGGFTGITLLLMWIVPMFFIDTINEKVRVVIKETIKGEVEFDKIDLSFYTKFPFLTANISKPSISGVNQDSISSTQLFEAESVSLGVNPFALLSGKVSFGRIYVDKPFVNVNVMEDGSSNYDIFYASESNELEEDSDLELNINRLHIKNAEVIYNDLASKLSFVMQNFDYVGRGNMSEAIFDLKSVIRIQSFDLNFDGVHYVKEKPILAKLSTQIDTKSLTLIFERNDIRIKDLPVDFKGKFAFIENGYDMLFDIKTKDSSLEQLLSVIPPEYQDWLDNTVIKGTVTGDFLLEGKYVIADSLAPNVNLNLQVNNGYIQHGELTKPLENLELGFSFSLPGLDIQKNEVNVNNLSFSVDGKKSLLNLSSKGIDSLHVNGSIDSNLDLALFNKAVGNSSFDMKGDLTMKGNVDGLFTKDIVVSRTLRKTITDTVISSVPKFDITTTLRNGYFKLEQLPEAISKVDVDLEAIGKDSNYKNIAINLNHISLLAMDNFIEGKAKIKNLHNYDLQGDLKAKVDLDNVKEFIPISDMEIRGLVNIDGSVNGTFEPNRKRFPIVSADIKMENGYLRFDRIPELPVEDIHIHTKINSKRGSMSDLTVEVLPIDFKIADESFQIAASLYNLNNLNYTVKSKGVLNIDNLYKLFKIDGIDVKGKIVTNLFLSGLQSDAVNGNFDKLKNGGRFEVDNITVSSELFPKPLHIKKGVFKFFKEKMKFEKFEAQYGSSKFSMNGYLTNVINYILKEDTIQGKFDLETPFMNVDEFMVFADNQSTSTKVSSDNTGVIQVPGNIDITFTADAKKVKYTDYNLNDFNGELVINKGQINLNKTQFELVGTNVGMTGRYKPNGLRKAEFEYAIDASNFDIQRAYKEVPMFREMVSMAKDAYGTVSLDYKLKGNLNSGMFPVMRSLEGEGTLTLEDIKFKSFKLLGAIADKTDAKSLEKGNVSKVDIKSSIKDNVLTIERTKMKMAGFRPRFEGQVSLDGEMNIGFRLGLPPMGIIGIPMKITGSPEDFKIKLGKYKPSEVLGKSTEDDEEDDEVEVKSVNDPMPTLPEENNATPPNITENAA
ncbi:AsmA family protein [Myroides sp. BIT-d1]|uniref:AsmA family protein n=2 Tax=Myroides albus TaxID=2562892 RepID=A0A6I3LBZ2_9FLAO|nr:AsmA family protein [Myroides albus]